MSEKKSVRELNTYVARVWPTRLSIRAALSPRRPAVSVNQSIQNDCFVTKIRGFQPGSRIRYVDDLAISCHGEYAQGADDSKPPRAGDSYAGPVIHEQKCFLQAQRKVDCGILAGIQPAISRQFRRWGGIDHQPGWRPPCPGPHRLRRAGMQKLVHNDGRDRDRAEKSWQQINMPDQDQIP